MRKFSAVLILMILVVVMGGMGAAQSLYNYSLAVAVVKDVVDGDTLEVNYISGGQGLPALVEFYLVDAPEYIQGSLFMPSNIQCYGKESTEFAKGLLLNRTVWLRHQNRVSVSNFISRLHAFVFLDSDEQSLYQAMALSQGMVVRDVIHTEEQLFFPRVIKLENEAKNAKRGLWGAC